MLKLMIFDDEESAGLFEALLSPYYEIVKQTEELSMRELRDKVKEINPDVILFATSFSDFGWENILSNMEREIEGFGDVVKMIISDSPASSVVNAVQRCGADMTVRPFEPLAFMARLSANAQRRIPVKDRSDGVTGLHKKEFTGEKIREEIGRSSGTMFLIEVAKYSFAAGRVGEDIMKKCSEIITEEMATCGGTVGIAAGNRFIGFVPGLIGREAGTEWGNELADKIKSGVKEKLYLSVGLAESDGKPESYSDLYQLCDKALGLSRASTQTAVSYY